MPGLGSAETPRKSPLGGPKFRPGLDRQKRHANRLRMGPNCKHNPLGDASGDRRLVWLETTRQSQTKNMPIAGPKTEVNAALGPSFQADRYRASTVPRRRRLNMPHEVQNACTGERGGGFLPCMCRMPRARMGRNTARIPGATTWARQPHWVSPDGRTHTKKNAQGHRRQPGNAPRRGHPQDIRLQHVPWSWNPFAAADTETAHGLAQHGRAIPANATHGGAWSRGRTVSRGHLLIVGSETVLFPFSVPDLAVANL